MKPHGYVEWFAYKAKIDKKTGEPVAPMSAWPKTKPYCAICSWGLTHPYHGGRGQPVESRV